MPKEFGKPAVILISRPDKNRLFYVCYRICTHWIFTLFITILIIINTIVLALDKFPEEPEKTKITSMLNDVFTWAFSLEMVIKLIGLGFG